MRILVTGATGFIGSAITAALHDAGHVVVACVHRSARGLSPGVETVRVDYLRDTDPAAWLPRLQGVHAVVNTVGILRERGEATFGALHERAPRALFAACERAGVQRVIQVSALGADAHAASRYHLTKKAADDALRASRLEWTIVQPSLVFGSRSASTRLFLTLASLPLIPLVGRGDQPIQPIHIDDLATLVVRLIDDHAAVGETIAAVGRDAVTLRELLVRYRQAIGLRATRTLPMPIPLMRLSAYVGDALRLGPLSRETLGMLQRGNIASTEAIARILGRAPRALDTFIAPEQAPAFRLTAAWSWTQPLLRLSIAIVWITAGVVSLLYAKEQGLTLLAALGLPPALALTAFLAAVAIDIALGAATLLRPGRRLWLAQLAVMVFYTAALSVVAPQLWADPFGPLVKNLPIAAVLVAFLALDER